MIRSLLTAVATISGFEILEWLLGPNVADAIAIVVFAVCVLALAYHPGDAEEPKP